jgi:murein DD-endopeptidase MepM/ murein hydrolase activator NlpD
MRYPVDNPVITSPYGKRILNGKEQFHDGIDFISRERNSVYSIANGIVIYDKDDYNEIKRWDVNLSDSGGNFVIISHNINNKNYFCRYLHLERNIVEKNQYINQSDLIGKYADVGYSFGAHLHFDCYDDKWIKIDPTFIFEGLA